MSVLINEQETCPGSRERDSGELRHRQRVVSALRAALDIPDIQGDLIASCRPRAAALATRITSRIQREVFAFAATPDPRIAQAIAEAISGAVDLFMDALADVPSRSSDIYAYFRTLGALEAAAGHDLDAMRAAHHIATQESWDELRQITSDLGLPLEVTARLGDALLAYQRQLFDEAFAGFAGGRGGPRPARQDARSRLLVALLSGADADQLTHLAQGCEWELPETIAVAAADLGTDVEVMAILAGHDAALAGVRRGRLIIVVDASSVAPTVTSIASRAGSPVAVSWGVTPEDAHHAARWADRALSLTAQGIISVPDDGLVWCRNHQAHLCLHADPTLRRHADADLLAPLLAEKPKRRAALAGTMLLWLQTRHSAPALAEQLGVHEQTVRHRLRHLKSLFHDELADPGHTVGLLTALESATPRWRREAA